MAKGKGTHEPPITFNINIKKDIDMLPHPDRECVVAILDAIITISRKLDTSQAKHVLRRGLEEMSRLLVKKDIDSKFRAITEEESDILLNLKNKYWTEFSKLIASILQDAPESLHDHLLMDLQDLSSVYGSEFDKYLSTPKT